MPIAPQPITYHCPACRWSKTVAPRSDALMPGDTFNSCPACGHAELEQRQASSLEATVVMALRRVLGFGR